MSTVDRVGLIAYFCNLPKTREEVLNLIGWSKGIESSHDNSGWGSGPDGCFGIILVAPQMIRRDTKAALPMVSGTLRIVGYPQTRVRRRRLIIL